MNDLQLFLLEYGFYFCIALSVLWCFLEYKGIVPDLGQIIFDYEAKYLLRAEAKRGKVRGGNQ